MTLIAQAKTDLKAGKVADARKDLDQVAAMDVKLGWQDRTALAGVKDDVADAEKAAKVAAAKPAEKPPAVVAAKPAEKPPVVVAAKPAEKAPEAKPAEKAPAKPSAMDQVAEARKLYEAKKYDDSLKLLKSVNTDDLNFFEKVFTYNPLVSKVEKAIAEDQAAKIAATAKPVEKPAVAKPAEKPVEVVVAKPVEKPVAEVKPVAAPVVAARS